MVKVVIFGFGMFAPAIALACGGDKDCGSCSHHDEAATTAAVAPQDPAACAKKAELVGGACSYTTGMMASRVLTEGKPWSFTGTLARVEGDLQSHVAAPFTVGPQKVYVVANEILESLTAANAQQGRVGLEGKVLEVEGVQYFVLTSYAVSTS